MAVIDVRGIEAPLPQRVCRADRDRGTRMVLRASRKIDEQLSLATRRARLRPAFCEAESHGPSPFAPCDPPVTGIL